MNASMYDASQGSKAGAHIEATTRSGTNEFHGEAYDYLQNNIFNAASFFRNASPAISEHDKVPALHYNRFGATLGGPIFKNKLFFFGAYQGIRDHDALNGTSTLTSPLHLTDDRSAQGLANMLQADFGKTVSPSQIDPAALQLFQAKGGRQVSDSDSSVHPIRRSPSSWATSVISNGAGGIRCGSGDHRYRLSDQQPGPALPEVYLPDRSLDGPVRRRRYPRIPQGSARRDTDGVVGQHHDSRLLH